MSRGLRAALWLALAGAGAYLLETSDERAVWVTICSAKAAFAAAEKGRR